MTSVRLLPTPPFRWMNGCRRCFLLTEDVTLSQRKICHRWISFLDRNSILTHFAAPRCQHSINFELTVWCDRSCRDGVALDVWFFHPLITAQRHRDDSIIRLSLIAPTRSRRRRLIGGQRLSLINHLFSDWSLAPPLPIAGTTSRFDDSDKITLDISSHRGKRLASWLK